MDKRDRNEIRPEMRVVKQHLLTTKAISEQNRISREQIFDAYKIATDKKDPRPFDGRLKEYINHEYFSPLDPKETSFRITDKFLNMV
jgi:hypothetical protein